MADLTLPSPITSSTPRWFGVPPVGQVEMWVDGMVDMPSTGARGPGGNRGSS